MVRRRPTYSDHVRIIQIKIEDRGFRDIILSASNRGKAISTHEPATRHCKKPTNN